MAVKQFTVVGKTAIVTGAGSGINLAFARLLLSRGCNVVLADIFLKPAAKALIDEFKPSSNAQHPHAVWAETDVTSWPSLEKMFDIALEHFGNFDILCPGAGIYEPLFSSFWRPPGSTISKDNINGGRYAVIDINVTHPIRATQMALSYWLHPRRISESSLKQDLTPKASPQNPKRIIHVSSIAAQVPSFIAPMYVASKHAINGFVRSLAPLEADFGVRVNAVAPGVVQTPLWTDRPDRMQHLDMSTDVWVTADEVADAMLRCIESENLIGGTVLEVGPGTTREVHTFGDPGPNLGPSGGFIASNAKKLAPVEVASCLDDASLWGAWRD